MGITIGRRWPRKAPIGDHTVMCDDCGVHYRRSQLRRMEDGRLSCIGPGTNNDGKGRVEVALDRANAMHAQRRRGPTIVRDTGNFDNSGPDANGVDNSTAVFRTTLEDIEL